MDYLKVNGWENFLSKTVLLSGFSVTNQKLETMSHVSMLKIEQISKLIIRS